MPGTGSAVVTNVRHAPLVDRIRLAAPLAFQKRFLGRSKGTQLIPNVAGERKETFTSLW
jgi:hypothetical protein